MEIRGPVAAILDSRATVYMARKNPKKALADLEKAILEKDTPVRLFHQARAYLLQGQTRVAVASMKKALGNGLTPNMLEPLEKPYYNDLMKKSNSK